MSELKATFWAQLTEGVNYVRCHQPAKYLPGKVIQLNEQDLAERPDGSMYFPRQEGAAIWSFSGNITRGILMAEMQEQGIPVLFEADDDYTRPPDFNELSAWKVKYDRTDDHNYEVATRIASFADGVIVSTPRLAEVYSEHNSNVFVCPNCVDPDDWPSVYRPEDDILRVGWAASDSHRFDAPLIKRAVEWLSGRKNVEVIILGIHPRFLPFKYPYVHIGWTDSLKHYRALLNTLDVMLCPLQRTEWSDGKSDLKAVDGAMAGAMAVVSKSPAYEPWFDRTFTCESEKDFLRVVRHLYKNRDEVKRLQKEHKEYVLRERQIKDGVENWRKAIAAVS